MFFDNLKFACKEKGTSPSAIALSLGMSKSNVTNWRNGQLPSVDVLLKISKELDVSIDCLLGINETKKDAVSANTDDIDEINEFREAIEMLPPAGREELLRYAHYLISRKQGE